MFNSVKNQIIFISLLTFIITCVFSFYIFAQGEDFLVIASQQLSQKELFSILQEHTKTMALSSFIFIITIFILFAVIFMSMVFTVQLCLRAILHGIKQIDSGNLRYRITLKSKNEFGVIAQFLNETVSHIDAFQQEIRAVNAGLEKKVSDRTQELSNNILLIREKNKKLEDIKRAMLNLLEDARELEEQLKQEKAGVEKKVKERTRELFEEQARLQASIDNLSMGYIMTDVNNEIMLINGVAKSILCVTHGSLPMGVIGNASMNFECNVEEISKQLEGRFDFLGSIQKVFNEKKPLEFKKVTFNDRFLHIRMSPIVLPDSNFVVIGVVTLVEDETEAFILERSKNEFFSIASHELRTPLTAIRGNTSLIQQYYADKVKDEEFKQMITDIHDSSVRLIEIVNDFLDVSRIEQGKIVYKKSQFDIHTAVGEVIKELETIALEKKLYIKDESTTVFPLVFADRDRVKQILLNLVGNALKFTETGGVSVAITQEGALLKIAVTDSGKGIPQLNQKLLFRRFQQAGGDIFTRDATRGTGLGLYISKLMVEGMGGTITLEKSEENKGSTFAFTLPVFFSS